MASCMFSLKRLKFCFSRLGLQGRSGRHIKAAPSKQKSTSPSTATEWAAFAPAVHAASMTFHFFSEGSASQLPWPSGLLSLQAAATFLLIQPQYKS